MQSRQRRKGMGMECNITQDGSLRLEVYSTTDAYALRRWAEDNIVRGDLILNMEIAYHGSAVERNTVSRRGRPAINDWENETEVASGSNVVSIHTLAGHDENTSS